MATEKAAKLSETLPPADEVRERLSAALREADLARKLLRVIARRDAFRAADEARRAESVGG
jgi:hypothetical protein